MSFGKGGGTTIQTSEMTPEQRAQIGAQTNFFTGTIAPAYQQAVGGAQDVYKNVAPGVGAAAQNLQGTAAQAQTAPAMDQGHSTSIAQHVQQQEDLEVEGVQQLDVFAVWGGQQAASDCATGAQQATPSTGRVVSLKTGMFPNVWKCSQAMPWGSVIQCFSLRA